MACPICGEDVREGWRFCPQCGQSQTEQAKPGSGATDVTEGGPEVEVRVTPDFKPWSTVEHGSLWRRAGAEFVDVMLVLVVLAALIPAVREVVETRGLHGFGWLWVVEIVSIPYRVVAEWSKFQATVGKWLFGLAVTDQKYRRVSFWSALVRGVVKGVAFPGYAVGLLLFRSFVDETTDTVVIRRWW